MVWYRQVNLKVGWELLFLPKFNKRFFVLIVVAALIGLSGRFMTVNAVVLPDISVSTPQPTPAPGTTEGIYDGTLMKMTDISYTDMSADVGETFQTLRQNNGLPRGIVSQIRTVNGLDWHVPAKEASQYFFSDLNNWKIINAVNAEASQGFYAIAFLRGNTVVIAYRGTDNLQDVVSDATIYLNLQVEVAQRKLAMKFAEDVSNSLNAGSNSGPYHVIFTGHSIGGWLAQQVYQSVANSQTHDGWQTYDATVFNSIGTEFQSTPAGKARVKDYHLQGDVFSDFGTSLGKRIVVPAPNPNESLYDKHQMFNFYSYFYPETSK